MSSHLFNDIPVFREGWQIYLSRKNFPVLQKVEFSDMYGKQGKYERVGDAWGKCPGSDWTELMFSQRDGELHDVQ